MKKIRVQFTLKKSLISLTGLIFLFTLISCENFLNGSTSKKNLEEQIAYTTASDANVTVKKSNVDDTGNLEPAGNVHGVKVGYPIELSYEPSSAYYFVNWTALNSKGDAFSETEVEFKEASNPVTTVTINTTEKVIIQANSTLREKLAFVFDGENGSTVPAESKSYYDGEEFNLSWKADSSYAFLNWEVYDAADKKTKLESSEYNKYLSFENIKSDETTVKILDTGKKFVIKARSVQRPKIVTATPLYDTAGVYRDRTIVVMFDKEMDESSIYWSEEEVKEILEDTFENYTLLPEEGKLINETKYFYGYVNKSDENDVTFKNITITELSNQSNNLLKYYEAPEFDFGNKRTLRIKTKTVDEISEETGLPEKVAYAPDSAIEILVTIGKKFTQDYEGNKVNLSTNYSWAYFTNYNTDVAGPVFTENKLHITASGVNQTSYDSSKSDLHSSVYSNKSELKNYNIKDGKLWVSAEISDAGIGASKMNIVIKQIIDGEEKALFYPLSDEPGYMDLMLNTKVAGQNAMVSQTVDISSLPEGFYETYLVGYDKNDRYTESEKFYFIYDVVGPHITSTFTYKSTTAIDKITVVKNENNDSQYGGYSKICDILCDDNVTEHELTNLGEDSRTHSIKITDYDYFGNETVSYQEIAAIPSIGMIYYLDGYWSYEYVPEKTPAGIIFDPDQKNNPYGNCRIVDLYIDKTTRKIVNYYNGWGSGPYGWCDPYVNDGRSMYEAAKDYWEKNNINVSNVSQLYDYLINTKNKESIWSENGIVWYLPGLNEYVRLDVFYGLYRSDLSAAVSKGYQTLKAYYANESDIPVIDSISEMACSTLKDGNQLITAYSRYGKDNYYVFGSGGHCTWSLYMAHVTLK